MLMPNVHNNKRQEHCDRVRKRQAHGRQQDRWRKKDEEREADRTKTGSCPWRRDTDRVMDTEEGHEWT
jgi:hypothetical protein